MLGEVSLRDGNVSNGVLKIQIRQRKKRGREKTFKDEVLVQESYDGMQYSVIV